MIGRYCPRIKSLSYYPSIKGDDNVLSFFRMYGHKLEELYIDENFLEITEEMKQILKFCPNVKSIKCPFLERYFNKEINILPKLEHIKSLLVISHLDMNLIEKLPDKYSQTIKTLHICPGHIMDDEELKTCIECIARFENFKELNLIFGYLKTTQPIDNLVSLIGQKQASPIGGGGGYYPPTPLPRASDPPPPPLAASEASRHFFRVFSSFFAFNHD